MNNKGKVIRLLIAIIIPLLAAVFIANYSYNWDVYKNKFQEDYLQKETTNEEGIDNFIEFDSYLYEKEPYLFEQYKDENGKVLFDLKVYRTISFFDEKPTFVNYKFFIYNVDYESLIHITKDNVKENTPRDVKFKIALIPGDKSPRNLVMNDFSLRDLTALPEYNHKNEKTSYAIKFNTVGGLEFPTDIKLKVYEGDLTYDEDTHEVRPKDIDEYTEFLSLDLTGFTFKSDDIDSNKLVHGFNKDVLKAGFGTYVLKAKIWWQVLLTLVITGFITFSFLIVWDYEQQEKKTNKKK